MANSMTYIMLSPIPFKSFSVSSGSVYVADQFGIIPNVATQQDASDLTSAGCSTLNPAPTGLIASIKGANFNSTADQLFLFNNATRFVIDRIIACNASVSLTTAAGGLYTGAGKTGTTIVGAGQVYSALTSPTADVLNLTLSDANTLYLAGTSLYFSLTTPQGAPATGDLYVFGKALP